MSTLTLACTCGAVRGEARRVSPGAGLRIVCMCDDCQAAVRWLERPELLDRAGGTEVYTTTPARLSIDAGPHLAAFRLGQKGLLRWYASCCRTPIANTPSPRVAFAGLHRAFIADAEIDRKIGDERTHVQARFASGPPPERASRRAPLGLIARSMTHLAREQLRGERSPSPFHAATGAPLVEPRVLSTQERADLG